MIDGLVMRAGVVGAAALACLLVGESRSGDDEEASPGMLAVRYDGPATNISQLAAWLSETTIWHPAVGDVRLSVESLGTGGAVVWHDASGGQVREVEERFRLQASNGMSGFLGGYSQEAAGAVFNESRELDFEAAFSAEGHRFVVHGVDPEH
jgi:hypothetical protein